MKRVAVVGGGIAGLTAAFRLAERGYEVTLYEQEEMLGGNLASRRGKDGAPHDIYPHMYLNWYHNFWKLLDDVGCDDRDKVFAPMSRVSFSLRDVPGYKSLTNTFSPWHFLQNLFSGVAPPADMFLFIYASVDLLAERLNPAMLVDDVSVNGFLQGRPYITERAAEVLNYWITNVWAIPSYLTSAADYQTFLKHGYAEPSPAFWLLRGASEDRIIAPIEKALTQKGAKIRRSTEVTKVSCDGGRVQEITWRAKGKESTEQIDDLVLAVPPPALSTLVRTGDAGHRILDAEAALAGVARLRTEAIPIVHLYFTRKLSDIPPEPVGLVRSKYALAFTDVSQTAEGIAQWEGVTVLALSSSERYGLPGTGDAREDAMAMIRELARYVTDFEAGTAWGDSHDINWDRTTIEYNEGTRLFVNETGSDAWRPRTGCATLRNLHLAGDYCQNQIGMTSVEAAVVTGLSAAQSVVDRRGGPPVDITQPRDFSRLLYAWLRFVGAPYAATATICSKGSDLFGGIARDFGIGRSTLRYLLTPTPLRSQR